MNAVSRREFLRLLPCGALGFALPVLACGPALKIAELDKARRAALDRAARFLVEFQGTDGAWRSDHYGFFRSGDALTPLVLTALQTCSDRDYLAEQGLVGGSEWLEILTDRVSKSSEAWSKLRYPLFTASYAARYYGALGDTARAATWVECIAGLQHSEALGWLPGEARHGAWSDAPVPPQKPEGRGEEVPDMLNPNISATAIAVLGLAAAGGVDRARLALPFIEKCQNWRSNGNDQEPAFDDGGFFFALGDPARNKAGVAGKDAAGLQRFRSYGSATCDGILSLLAFGAKPSDARVSAGLEWLRTRLTVELNHAGAWPTDRADSGRALLYYYAQALGLVLKQCKELPWVGRAQENLWRGLIALQNRDGSWSNPDADSCEDDPIVATAFAMHALAN
jgi:hypothetical protein